MSGSVAIDRSYIEIDGDALRLAAGSSRGHRNPSKRSPPVPVGPCPPHAEVILEVLGGQVGGSDLLDVLVRQPTAGVCMHGDQLVLAEDQRVQAGVGKPLAQRRYRPPDRLGEIR